MGVSLWEKHRPKTWADVVGQEQAVNRLLDIKAREGLDGKYFLLLGHPSTGKTTLARIIANEIAADPLAIEELDAGRLTPARMELIEDAMQQRPWWGGGKAYIVDEAEGLSADVVRRLLLLRDRLPGHVSFIFCFMTDCFKAWTNKAAGDTRKAFLQRCKRVNLTNQGFKAAFAPVLKRIAEAEGLDGQPLEAYAQLMEENNNSPRACLDLIGEGYMLKAGGT